MSKGELLDVSNLSQITLEIFKNDNKMFLQASSLVQAMPG